MRRIEQLATMILAAIVLIPPSSAAGQVTAPALTAAQVRDSEALAAKFDQSAVKEQRRLEVFKGRPLGAVIQRAFNINANYLLMAAQMMPEGAYRFRPTVEVRTFGEQMNHAMVSHYSFCNQAGTPPGAARKAAPPQASLTTKADIVKALEESIAYCDSVLAASTEAWLMEMAPRVGGSSSGLVEGIRAHAFMYNNVHDAEDYGTITTYLRMSGVVPPSSAIHVAPASAR